MCFSIYNLRVRVAEPGRTVTPPASSKDKDRSSAEVRRQRKASSSGSRSGLDSGSQPSTPPDFVPEQCIFCDKASDTFQHNISHMSKNHSFIIPYREALAVDVETVVAYLHLVVYGYRECILCGIRRGTLEAVQQHMTAKGHCRLDINSETTEFYKSLLESLDGLSGLVRPDDGSPRLPSGKRLSYRHRRNDTTHRSTRRAFDEDEGEPKSRPQPSNTDTTLTRVEHDPLAPSMQLVQLSRGDQRSLAHLPSHEVRALLSASIKDIDRSRRLETRSKLKLERAKNETLMTRSRLGYRVNLRVG